MTSAVAIDTMAPPAVRRREQATVDTPPTGRNGGTLAFVALAVVALAAVFVLGWNLAGGTLQVMETPSMCPEVCVGSLVAAAPLSGPVHVGELVTFHPPNSHAETYTHEVARIFRNGMIQTRGVGNPHDDPWLITRSDIVGKVDFTVWGVGWLLKALPLFAVGVLAWLVTTPLVAPRSRRAWDRIWMTVLAVVPLWMLHPLIKATVISTVSDPQRHRWQRITVVNTGLLPSSFHVMGGDVTSHVGSTHLARSAGPANSHGAILVSQSVSLYWWGWVLVACMVSLPLVGFLWHVWRNDEALIPAIPA
jgi:signal peptidase I